MAAVTNEYEVYNAPDILATARYLVNFPRKDYSMDFATLIAGDDEERDAYKSGLLVLACILASIYAIWILILLVLKCKGKSVGCASGRSFRGERIIPEHRGDGAGSTDIEDEWASRAENSRAEGGLGEESSFQSSIKSSELDESASNTETASEDEVISIPTLREKRTQIAFFLFGMITLSTVPLVLTLSFSPLKRALDSSDGYITQSRAILSKVDNTLKAINVAVESTADIFTNIPSTAEELCPSQTFQAIEDTYGIDMNFIASVITEKYEKTQEVVDSKLADVASNANEFDDVLHVLEEKKEDTETYLWAVPGFMLGLTSVTTALLFGVLLAWKRQSNSQAQRVLSYGVLPCLILLSFVCWLVGISSAVAVALFSDACTQGKTSGAPSKLVENIALLQGYEHNSTTFKVVKSFTSGCNIDVNPTLHIEKLENDIQQIVDEIWGYILQIDTVGRHDLIDMCGSESLKEVILDAQEIARLLTTVRRALSILASAVKCEDIYPIFAGTIDDAVCTDLATSSSWAMFMFLALGISTMCMISLRASWRHTVGEDQIYNEDEVAENMFLDEHEEYLHYISKYKHEWEEYGGINAVVPMTPGARRSLYDETSESEETTGSRTSVGEDLPNEDGSDRDVEVDAMKYLSTYTEQQEAFNPYHGTTPASPSTDASEDISFLSLRSLQIKTPQSKTEESDSEAEISSSKICKEKGINKKKSSALDLFKEAVDQYSTIFRTQKKQDGDDAQKSLKSKVMRHPDNQSGHFPRASSDVGRDDSSFASLKPVRTATSEGGGYFKKSWRTRTNISHLSGDLQQFRDTAMATTTNQPRCVEPTLAPLPNGEDISTAPLSARAQSAYSL